MVVIHQLLVDKPLTGSAALSIYLNATYVVEISYYLFTEFVSLSKNDGGAVRIGSYHWSKRG